MSWPNLLAQVENVNSMIKREANWTPSSVGHGASALTPLQCSREEATEAKEDAMSQDTPRSHTPPGEGMRRLIGDILATTIPKKRLQHATAIAIDQTAFPSFFRSRDFRKRKTLIRRSPKRCARPGGFPLT